MVAERASFSTSRQWRRLTLLPRSARWYTPAPFLRPRSDPVLSRWPIRNKLLVLIALMLVTIVTLSASGFHATYAYRGLVRGLRGRATELPLAQRLTANANDARITLAQARGLAEEIDHATAGYEMAARLPDLLSGRFDSLAEQFHHNLSVSRDTLAAYRAELMENDLSEHSINNSRDEWQSIGRIEDSLQALDQIVLEPDWLRMPERRAAAERELAALAGHCRELPSFLHHRLGAMVDEVRTQYRTLIFLDYATSIAAPVLLGVLLRLMYSWIFRPLRLLIKGSRGVAAGDFNYRIHLRTRDEMSELAEALNDMTSRFQAIRDDLDRQVRERTQQVVRSEQLASVGFLAAGVAHEINNPLASIALCAESLEGRVDAALAGAESASPGEQDVIRTYLRMIQDEAFRCKGITERLLDFSRLGDVRPHATDMGELVGGVIRMLSHLGKYHDKRVVFEPGPTVIALVNEQEMKQVVLNLLTNGLDAVADGGEVRVTLRADDDKAALTITDNGCGMTDEVRRHLFEPFFTRRRTGQGIGLGLSITYRIVADHGGTIEAFSDGPGQGSEFRVTLPLVQHAKETTHRNQAA